MELGEIGNKFLRIHLPFYHQHDFLKMHHFYISAKHKINKKWHGKQAIEKWL